MTDHAAELKPLFDAFARSFRQSTKDFLGNKVCSTCATDLYLKILAGAMVVSYQAICDATRERADPLDLIEYLQDAWNDERETLQ